MNIIYSTEKNSVRNQAAAVKWKAITFTASVYDKFLVFLEMIRIKLLFVN